MASRPPGSAHSPKTWSHRRADLASGWPFESAQRCTVRRRICVRRHGLCGHCLQRTVAKFRITLLDVSEAEAAPGAVLVMTHRNAPRLRPPPLYLTQEKASGGYSLPVMQDDRIHWNGQPIALVLAETQEQADHAVSLIRVSHESESPLTSFAEARARATPQRSSWENATSQFRGGIIMGLGLALMEETQFDERNGRIMDPSLAEYHVPVHLDVPEIDVIWTDIPDPHAPWERAVLARLASPASAPRSRTPCTTRREGASATCQSRSTS